MEDHKIKIIFMGTPEFGAIVLEELVKNDYKPVLVITAPDKPVGRKQILTPSPVKIIADEYNISLGQPEKIQDTKYKIQNTKPDLIIVASYGQILPKEILDIPKYGCLNVHPSLLPKYRGPSPIQYAILNGDKETGVTIMLMDEKMDHGPILAQQELEFQISNFQFLNLHDKLAELGAKLLLDTIPKWLNKEIKPQTQDESKATYTKILTKEDGKIDWRKSVEVLERQIRAFSPWPGSYTIFNDGGRVMKIKILKARIYQSPDGSRYPIGKVLVVPQNEIGVQCEKDFLVIERLQMEGKEEMDSENFLRGKPGFIGAILK